MRSAVLSKEERKGRLDTSFKSTEPSLTRQDHKDSVDINKIVKAYGVGNTDPIAPGTYGDFTDVHDFQTAQQAIIDAEEAFMTLPSVYRAEFDNDPGKFLAWYDQADEDALREKGLLNDPAPEEPPINVNVVNAPPEEPPEAA